MASHSSSPQSAIRNPQLLEFHVPFSHTGTVDKANGVVHGVSLITGGIKARGHDLEVDNVTLQQILKCAVEMGSVPVKWNHKTGADAVNGYVTDFFIDGQNLRGNWHLLQTHSQYQQALELAERMPKNIGLSAAFVPPEKVKAGDAGKARCEELVSVDLVAQPAANPSGLFSRKVDSEGNDNSMADKIPTASAAPAIPAAEPTLADVIALIQAQDAKINTLTENLQSLQQNPNDEPSLVDLADMTDEQLIDAGFDPAAVDQAIQTAIQNGELTVDGQEQPDGQQQNGVGGQQQSGAGSGNGNGAATAAAAPAMAALGDLRKRIEYFETKERRETMMAEKAEEESLLTAFEVLEAKTVELAARNDALELALRSGAGRAASPGSEIQLDAKTGEPLSYEALVNTEFNRLMKSGGKDLTELSAKSKAVSHVIAKYPAAYREFRSSGRAAIEFAVQ